MANDTLVRYAQDFLESDDNLQHNLSFRQYVTDVYGCDWTQSELDQALCVAEQKNHDDLMYWIDVHPLNN